MWQTVLIYFKFHQDEFQLFLDAAGGLDYQFDVAMDSTGKLKVILFVPTNSPVLTPHTKRSLFAGIAYNCYMQYLPTDSDGRDWLNREWGPDKSHTTDNENHRPHTYHDPLTAVLLAPAFEEYQSFTVGKLFTAEGTRSDNDLLRPGWFSLKTPFRSADTGRYRNPADHVRYR
jgi:hypothetical protein